MGWVEALTGSVIMGAGIVGVHYIGMAAMRLPAITRYSPLLVTGSILLAILSSLIALLMVFDSREENRGTLPRKLGSAMVMGAAASAMHYIGMAAASFIPASPPDLSHAVAISPVGNNAIAIVTLIVLVVAMVTSSVDRRASAEVERMNRDLERRVAERTLQLEAVNQALRNAFDEIKALKDELYKENLALKEEIGQTSMFEEIIGSSSALRSVLAHVERVAPTDSTVLLTGETGTGKELVARAIHKRSNRAAQAFVSVNCAAIPPSLVASELFGSEKGAFTGATERRLGRFELADGATIFLDEIGDLPPETQIALLRVLQERTFERVGGTQPIPVDVRVLAATNRELQAAVEAGTFRQDLFYRLNVFPIHVPPLRDRVEDIPLLVEYFAKQYAKKAGKNISSIKKKTLELLQVYDWPGNIRELQNVIERAVILCDGDTLAVDKTWLQRESPRPSVVRGLARLDENQEREMIESALKETRGRVSGPGGAAAKLGIPRSTLESRIRSLEIDKQRFKSG
jgi:transcriptional regulator with GAF, ATPase, and Fis domain